MAERDFGDDGNLIGSLTGATRLYALQGEGVLATLAVERWHGREALSALYRWDISVLAPQVGLDLPAWLGQRITLRTRLADGGEDRRSGLVCEARSLGSDGALARYRISLVPWLWLLTQGRHSRVFQDRALADILQAVFDAYASLAAWTFTADAKAQFAATRPRSYCVQYRESDYAFVTRLLVEEGLGFYFVEDAQAPSGHRLVIFADSTQLPQDSSSAGAFDGQGIRFHRADGTEQADAIQAIGQRQQLVCDTVSVLSTDYKRMRAITASLSLAGAQAQREHYEPVGAYAFAEAREAERAARYQIEAREAQQRRWLGKGTVRTARVGHWFQLSQMPWTGQGQTAPPQAFLWLALEHVGINNLPQSAMMRGDDGAAFDVALDPAVLERAQATGYAQAFDALARAQPWRPALDDGSGHRLNPRPTAPGVQTAIVVGPQGARRAGTTGPLHCDALGRLRVRFHWQREDDFGSCWVRVAQRYAGEGMGAQFLPRIGQEVLVQFVDGDIDRPLIVGALYNGQGESGMAPTPGGAHATAPAQAYAQARDGQPSAQANLAGGNSPAWHAMSGDMPGHANPGALSGIKTQGFDGAGYNQLVFDDSDGQGRIQFATTQAMSQLNLGHLIHQADNYRGSFRGQGFELRSDAYGAVHAQRGLLLSSYALGPGEPAGDVSALQALLKQQDQLAKALDTAAGTHLTAPLAAYRGVHNADPSRLAADAAPIAALQRSSATMVRGTALAQGLSDASRRQSAVADGTLPHSGDGLLSLAGRGGVGLLAGQALHWASGETLTLGSGNDVNLAAANQLRVHSAQTIGWLAGAQKAEGVGFSLIAGKGALDVQAQHDTLALRSRDQLTLVSVHADVEFAAAKTVHLATGGGAFLTIEGGRITIACPGKITVHANKKSFVGPAKLDRTFTPFPGNVCIECLLRAAAKAQPFVAR